jgi:large subunit ribosomal protein L17
MTHQKKGRKLKRDQDHRKALFYNMLQSLFRHGQIVTTVAKAKECAGRADKVITLTKRTERKIGEMEKKLKASVTGEITAELQKEIDLRTKAIRVAYLRRVIAQLHDQELTFKIFQEIGPLYKDRAGGYTRVLKLNRFQVGDNTQKAVLQLVEFPKTNEKAKTTEEKQAEKEKERKAKAGVKQKQKRRKERERAKERMKKEKEKKAQEKE